MYHETLIIKEHWPLLNKILFTYENIFCQGPWKSCYYYYFFMIKSKRWYWVLILVFLSTQVVSSQDDNFKRLVVSYVTGVDETFYPFVPQLFLMMTREQMITSFFESFERMIEKLPGTANLWMFESIKHEITQVKEWMRISAMDLIDRHNVKLVGEKKFESFQEFQKDLEGYYKEFGLEKSLKIHNEIEAVGRKIMEYQSTGSKKTLDEAKNRWNNLLNRLDSSYELKKKISQTIANHFMTSQDTKGTEVDTGSFSSDLSSRFWSLNLSNFKLLELFHEYGVQQLNLIYKQKLIWFRMTLTIGIINLETYLNRVHKLASSTVVHSISLTSLQYLYQIKDRIDFFLLNESYLENLLEVYENLSVAMNKWMGETLVLDDLQYLYAHLMKEGLDIRTLITDMFDQIKHYGEFDLIGFENKSEGRRVVDVKKGGRFLRYLSADWDMSLSVGNNVSASGSETEGQKPTERGESEEEETFRKMVELNVDSELEEEVLKNRHLYEDHIRFGLFLDRLEFRYSRFERQSKVFLEELENTSQSCQTLYFSASQAGNMIYEIVANEILNTSNRSGKINMNSSKQLKSLIRDLESVKESIDAVKETEEDSEATDILGESISDEDFIYVPGTIGNFKKSQTTSGHLIIRISVIVGLLVLAIVLYIYKDRILVRKVEISEESEIYERYCSRVSLDEVEFNSSQNSDNKRTMKRNKYYIVDSRSGNIILKQQK